MRQKLSIVLVFSVAVFTSTQAQTNCYPAEIEHDISLFKSDISHRQASNYRISKQLFALIKQGMSTQEVTRVLGPPERLFKVPDGFCWFYILHFAQAAGVIFDNQGRVLQVVHHFPDEEKRNANKVPEGIGTNSPTLQH